jgi:hypothetical protein
MLGYVEEAAPKLVLLEYSGKVAELSWLVVLIGKEILRLEHNTVTDHLGQALLVDPEEQAGQRSGHRRLLPIPF